MQAGCVKRPAVQEFGLQDSYQETFRSLHQQPQGLETNSLNTAALLRAAAVVGNGCHIADGIDSNSKRSKCTDTTLTARSGAFDTYIQILDALLLRCATGNFRSHLGSKGGTFARPLETLTTTRRPSQRTTLTISNRNDGIVERSMYVRDAVGDILSNFFADASRSCIYRSLGHILILSVVRCDGARLHRQMTCADRYQPITFSAWQHPYAGLSGYVHWCASAARVRVNRGGA
jgi:hypothetical protein